MLNLVPRTRDVKAFEDTPLEYVHVELHVIKALGDVGADSKRATTEVSLEWIRRALAEASAGRGGEDAWRNKDAVVYLFEAVTTRTGTLTVRPSPILCADCVELRSVGACNKA